MKRVSRPIQTDVGSFVGDAGTSAAVVELGGGGVRGRFEGVDYVVLCAHWIVVPGGERVVINDVGKFIECRGEMVEREVAAVVGALLEGCDERTEERPGDGRLLPGLDLGAVG